MTLIFEWKTVFAKHLIIKHKGIVVKIETDTSQN